MSAFALNQLKLGCYQPQLADIAPSKNQNYRWVIAFVLQQQYREALTLRPDYGPAQEGLNVAIAETTQSTPKPEARSVRAPDAKPGSLRIVRARS